jgi:hypothetical protein
MSSVDVAEAARQLHDIGSAARDDATREMLRELGNAIQVGDISESTGVAVGQNIRQVINRFELPPDAAAALLDVRVMLGNRLGLEANQYQWGSLLADRTRNFVGRGYVFEAIDDFVQSNASGYLVIQGDPGLGKSSILSEYVRRTGCVAHFNVRSLGITSAAQFLKSVCAQLITDAGLDYSELPVAATQDGAFLMKLLSEVRQGRPSSEPIVIAVDALDEVDLTAQPTGSNVLFLPSLLPEGIYFVMTRRVADLPLLTESPLRVFDLMDHPAENRTDIVAYVEAALRRPALRQWISDQGLSDKQFAETLADLSDTNFMYLRYILPDIEDGQYSNLTVDRLPSGLQNYYDDHWRHMGMAAKPLPRIKLRIVYVLSEAQRPVSSALLSELSTDSALAVDELAVLEVLDDWRQFLHEDQAGEARRYSVYHSSFRDFLHRKDVVRTAGLTIEGIHGLIADHLLGTLFVEE